MNRFNSRSGLRFGRACARRKARWANRRLIGRERGRLRFEALESRHLLALAEDLPLVFEVNAGQSDEQVDFLSRGQGYGVFLTAGEAVLSLNSPAADDDEGPRETDAVLRVQLIGAEQQAPTAIGLDPLPSKSNYFYGSDPARWITDVAEYGRVVYPQVYAGVDQIFSGSAGNLRYDFVVSPGGQVSDIGLNFAGADRLAVDAGGNLLIGLAGDTVAGNTVAWNTVTQHAPLIYQEYGGDTCPARQIVSGHYVLLGETRVGFEVGEYDLARPLVIDPTLTYSTYLGGTGNDQGLGIAAPVAVEVQTVNVTGTSGTFRLTFNGQSTPANPAIPFNATAAQVQTALEGLSTIGAGNVSVTKSTTGNVFTVSFIGTLAGSNQNQLQLVAGGTAATIATSADGSSTPYAFVTGLTASNPFPTSTGAFDTTFGGGQDVYVTKLNATGTARLFSTYIGGTVNDQGQGIAVDRAGNAYVTGLTAGGAFPTTTGAYQTTYGGGANDAFLFQLNAAGNNLLYSTYFGGTFDDRGSMIALDSTGQAVVAGFTNSDNLPTLNAFQPALANAANGSFDGLAARFNPALSGTAGLTYSTYLGGSGNDQVLGVDLDASGKVYLTGLTSSTTFPVSTVRFDATHNGSTNDAFVTKLDPAAAGAASLVYSTYLGGGGNEQGLGIAVDSAGNAYITGLTSSDNFPLVAPWQGFLSISNDAYVTKLNASGSALIYSTYLGGTGDDQGQFIDVDSTGSAYIVGQTQSMNFPLANASQTALGNLGGAGVNDAFVTRLAPSGAALLYSTYLGGSGNDQGLAIALDSSNPGHAFVTGLTASTNFATVNPSQAATGGGNDVFITKLTDAANHAPVLAPLGDQAVTKGSDLKLNVPALEPDAGAWTTGSTVAYAIPAGMVGNQAFTGSLGLDFDVASPIRITQLGVFDDGSNGLSRAITARIFDRNSPTTPLAVQTFAIGQTGTLIGGSRYLTLATPLDLPAGFQGTIEADGYGSGELNGNLAGGVGTLNAGGGAIVFVGTARFHNNPGVFPTSLDGVVNKYAAGTFLFETPTTAGLTYSLDSGPAGATINAATGVLSWTPPPTDAASWWRAEGNATDSVDGNHGTLQNGAAFDAGKVGQAFSFDGVDDIVTMPGSATGPLDVTGNQLAIETWVFPTSHSQPLNGFNTQFIFDKYSPIAPDGYKLTISGGVPITQIATANDPNFILFANTSLPLHAWSHVAVTYNGTSAQIYVNGVPAGSAALTGNIRHTSNEASIGNLAGNNTFGFMGRIDEVAVFGRSLSATEIQSIYAAGSDGKGSVGNYSRTLAVRVTDNGSPNLSDTQTVDLLVNSTAPSALVVTNTADGGPGSLRQAILNANVTTGTSAITVGFNIPTTDPGYNPATGVFTIAAAAPLPPITRTNVTIDGGTQTTNVGDTNPGQLGTGGTVGVDGLPLSLVNKPEVQIVGGPEAAVGLEIGANNVTVRGLAIHGFGQTASAYGQAAIRIRNVTGTLIENNIIGSSAAAFADPGAGLRTGRSGIFSEGGDNGTIRNNLIGYTGGYGIWLYTDSRGWQIQGNEIRGTGLESAVLDGIVFNWGISNTISGNLIAGNQANGIEMGERQNTIVNNTISGNGALLAGGAGTETSGIRLTWHGNTIDRNVIAGNYGAGVMVLTGISGNTITRNSIFGNGAIGTTGAAVTGQIGIDLLNTTDQNQRGTSPYRSLNDAGDADAGGNNLLNAPVLTSARLSGGNLEVSGFVTAAAPPVASYVLPVLGDAGPPALGAGNTSVRFGDTQEDYLISNPLNNWPQGAITLEWWMKTTSTLGSGIFSYATTTTANDFLVSTPSNLNVNIKDVGVNTGINVADGNWHHLAISWVSATGDLRVYRDGVQAFSTTLQAGQNLIPGGSLVLAQDQDSVGGLFDPNQRFIGNLDEVAIYSYALPLARVQAHFGAGTNYATVVTTDDPNTPTLDERPVNYWRLDEAPGVTIAANLGTTPAATYASTVELFLADPDPSGYGEGRTFIASRVEGSSDDTDAGTGTYNDLLLGADTTNKFTFSIPIASLPLAVQSQIALHAVLSATATQLNSTSEFSRNVEIKSANSGPVVASAAITPSVEEGGFATLTVNYTDADLLDGHIAAIDWGDGSTSAIQQTGSTALVSEPLSFGGHAYVVTRTTMSRYAAETLAQSLGGHLAVITSEAENQAVTSLIFNQFGSHQIAWIGLSDREDEGLHRWSNGEPVAYTNWVAGNPDNANGVDDYVETNVTVPGAWSDNIGTTARLAVIELAPQRTFTVRHQYRQQGSYSVGVTLNDNDSQPQSGSAAVSVTVNNSPPQLTTTANTSGVVTVNTAAVAGDQAGAAVAVIGRTLYVGVPQDDSLGVSNAGAVTVYDADTGAFIRRIRVDLGGYTAGANDQFGTSLAAFGSKLLIGAPFEDAGAIDAGAAYLFDPAANLLLRIANPFPETNDQFGWAVSGVGTNLAVSAKFDDIDGVANAGAAYLFGAGGGLLATVKKTKYVALDATSNHNDGTLSGTFTLGQPGTLTGDSNRAYELQGGQIAATIPQLNSAAGTVNTVSFWMKWNGQNTMMPIGFTAYDLFSSGANFGFNSGAGDLYGISSEALADDQWHLVTAVFANGYGLNNVGQNQIWVDGVQQALTLRVGTPSATLRSVTSEVTSVTMTSGGSGYTTAPTVTFSAAPAGGVTATGTATIVNGVVTSVTIVGGVGYVTPPTVTFSAPPAGGVTATGTANIALSARIGGWAADALNRFSGTLDEVAFFNRQLSATEIADQYSARSSPTYSATVAAQNPVAYYRLGEAVQPTPVNALGRNDQFGYALAATSDGQLLVGSLLDDAGAGDVGAVHIHDGTSGNFVRSIQTPFPRIAGQTQFGQAVAAAGNYIVVGSPLADLDGANNGAAYIFDRETGALLRMLQNPNATTTDQFGWAVAGVGADQVLIGAPTNDRGATNAGAAYLFDLTSGQFLAAFQKPTQVANDQFGFSVAADGERLAVGANLVDVVLPGGTAADAGAAYLFRASTLSLSATVLNEGGSVTATGSFRDSQTPTVLADSVRDFALVQGLNRWQYGYYATPAQASSFTQFAYADALSASWEESPTQPPWTVLNNMGGHPNGPPTGEVHWAVRRWTSPVAGTVNLSGVLAKTDPGGGNGIIGRIFVDGALQYSQSVAFDDTVGFNFSLPVSVLAGSTVDFVIDGNGNINFDSTRFTAAITLPPQSETHTATIDWGDGTSTVLPTFTGQSAAPIGTVSEPYAYQGHTYYALKASTLTRAQAEARAVAMGGHLASVNSLHENQFLIDTIRREYGSDLAAWIGLSDSAVDGTFAWPTGEPLYFTRWAAGQPVNTAGAIDGVAFNQGGAGNWTAIAATQSLTAAIVEFDGLRSFTLPHTYVDNATAITVTASEQSGASDVAATTIAVNNVAPSVAIVGAPATVTDGTPVHLTATVTDPGIADVLIYAWTVTKNGLPYAASSATDITFTPDDNGVYVAQLTVTDDDAGQGASQRTTNATGPTAYTAAGGANHALLLQRSGSFLELRDNGQIVKRPLLSLTTAVTITGAASLDGLQHDDLAVDFTAGQFSVAGGVSFAGGALGDDSLTVIGTAGADDVVITNSSVTLNGSVIHYSGVESLAVNTLAGSDDVFMPSLDVETALDFGPDFDTYQGDFDGTFGADLAISYSEFVALQAQNVGGTFDVIEDLAAPGTGVINELTVEEDILDGALVRGGRIIDGYVGDDQEGLVIATGDAAIDALEIGGDLTGELIAVDYDPLTGEPILDSGDIGTLLVGTGTEGGSISGSVMTGDLSSLDVGGDITTTGSIEVGHLGDGAIDGDMDGLIEATGDAAIDSLDIGGDLSGDVISVDYDADGNVILDSGEIETLTAGSISGTVTTGDLTSVAVEGDVTETGEIHVGHLGDGAIDGDMDGLIEATGNAAIDALDIGGDLSGNVISVDYDANGDPILDSGDIGTLLVGTGLEGGSVSGSVMTGDLTSVDVAGDITVTGSIEVGHLGDGAIDGDMDGLIEATGDAAIDALDIGGDLSGNVISVDYDANGDPILDSGDIGTLLVGTGLEGGSISGSVMTGDLTSVDVGGDITVTGSLEVGHLGNGAIDGDMDGLIEATGDAAIDALDIGGDLSGDVISVDYDANGNVILDSGAIDDLTVGSISGTVTTGTLTDIDVHGDVTDTGAIQVGHLIDGAIDGDMDGLIEATGDAAIDSLEIGGELSGDVISVDYDANGDPILDSGDIGTLLVGTGLEGGSISGSVMTGDLTSVDVGGDITVTGSLEVGHLGDGAIDGDMDGLIEATGDAAIDSLDIGGDLGGDLISVDYDADGHVILDSGDITTLTVAGSVSGDVMTGDLFGLNVGGDVTPAGEFHVGNLENGAIDGNMDGLIEASGFGTIGVLTVGRDVRGLIQALRDESLTSGAIGRLVAENVLGIVRATVLSELQYAGLCGETTVDQPVGAAIVGAICRGARDNFTVRGEIGPTTEDTPLLGNVPGSNPATFLTTALGARVTFNADGTFRSYDPTAPGNQLNRLAQAEKALDRFTYIHQTTGEEIAVTVRVTGLNDAPTANSDIPTIDEDHVLVIPAAGVLANDTDPDASDVLFVSALTVGGAPAAIGVEQTLASGVRLTVNANGSYTFDTRGVYNSLGVGETAHEGFSYQAADGFGGFSTASVNITITGVNDTPTASPDSGVATEDALTTVSPPGLLVNDSDPDVHDVLSVTGHSPASAKGAAVAVLPAGEYTYQATSPVLNGLAQGETTQDTFTYTLGDGHGGANTGVVTLTVTGLNDAPTASSTTLAAVEDGPAATTGVLADDVDSDDAPGTLTYAIIDSPAVGTATSNGDGTFTYSPGAAFQNLSAGQSQNVSFTFQATDRHAAGSTTQTVGVTVTGVNDQPAVSRTQAAVTVDEGSPAANSGSYSDIDAADVVSLTASIGVVAKTGTNGGGWTWTLAATDGPAQSQTVTITADDGHGGLATTTFNLTVVNVAPSNVAAAHASAIVENGTVVLSGSFVDPGALDTHTVVVSWGPGEGSTTLSVAAGETIFTASHQYRNDHPSLTASDLFTIGLTVTDKDGASGSGSTQVTIQNDAPQGLTLNSGEISEDGTFTLHGSFLDAGTLDPHTVEIGWGPGEGSTTLSLAAGVLNFTASHQYLDDKPSGTTFDVFSVGVTVSDDDSGSVAGGSTVRVNNVAPTASIVGAPATPQGSPEGTPLNLSSAVSDVGTQDTFTYAWSVTKNGAPFGPTGSAAGFSFTPNDQGTYVASLTVTDDDGGARTTSQTIGVFNVAPTASIIGTIRPVGQPSDFSSTVFDPGPLDTFTYAWSVTRNGSPLVLPPGTVTDAPTFSFTPNSNGDYAIRLTATDNSGAAGTAIRTFTLKDSFPQATINGAPATSPEGTVVDLTSTVTQAGSGHTHTYAWSVTKNDAPYGSPGIAPIFSFTPNDNGTYVVNLVVRDEELNEGSDSRLIVVSNVAPAPSISGPVSGTEGTAVTLGSAVSDPGTADTFTYAWAVTKNGSPFAAGSGPGITFTPNDDGTYLASLTVTDDDGGQGTSSRTIAVGNAPPAVAILGAPASGFEGTAIEVSSQVTDPGTLDTFTYAWSVTKNGTPYASGAASSFSFTPDDNGAYVLSLNVTDDDLGIGTTSHSIGVANVGPSNLALALSPTAIDEGQSTTLGGSFADLGTADTHRVTIHWGDTQPGTVLNLPAGVTTFSAPHTYADDNALDQFAISVTVTDNDLGGTSASASATVHNVPPAAAISGAPASSVEGTTIDLAGTVTDPGTADTFSYAWTVTKNGAPYANGAAANFGFTPNDDGTYVIGLTVTDDDGDAALAASKTIAVNNAPPTATIGGGVSSSPEGTPIALTSAIADPGAADTLTRQWSVTKDGGPYALPPGAVTTAAGFNFTPTDNGMYVVSLSVTDDDSGSVTATQPINVTNSLPVATILGARASLAEGTPVSLTSAVSDAGLADTFSFAWSVTKNGAAYATGSGPAFSFTPTDDGSYVVSLTATDDDGGAGVDSKTIGALNAPPTSAIVGAPLDSFEGTTIALASTITDPGSDTFTYAWSVRKGGALVAAGASANFSFTPTDNGIYVVNLVVTDDDLGTDSDSKSIQVHNVDPTPTILGAPSGTLEGASVSLTSSVSDPGSADTVLSYAWSVTRNGTPFGAGGSAPNFTFTPNDNGPYVVSLTVTDDDHGVQTASKTVSVSNLPPVLTSPAPQTAYQNLGTSIGLGSFFDSGADSPWKVTVDWGDTSPLETITAAAMGSLMSPPHAYANLTSYLVTVTVQDKDGEADTKTVPVTVLPARPSVTPPADQAAVEGADQTFQLGSFAHGLPGSHTWTVRVLWGDGQESTFTQTSPGSLGTLNHLYRDNGGYTAKVRVTDDTPLAGLAEATFLVNVSNSLPVIASWATSSPAAGGARQGENVTALAQFSDAGTLDTHTATIDWGDGQTTAGVVTEASGQGTVSGSHSYAAGGFYTATITLIDDDTGAATRTTATVIAGLGVQGNVLQIVGTSDMDLVVAYKAGATLTVHMVLGLAWCQSDDDWDEGDEVDQNWDHYNAAQYRRIDVPAASVQSILVRVIGGNDFVLPLGIGVPLDIDGGAGNDWLVGGAGNDTIADPLGNNSVYSGAGNDIVTTGSGNDRLWTDGGDDAVNAGDGNNEIHTDGGNDIVTTGSGNDLIYTGDGNDSVTDAGGQNAIYTDGGNDAVTAGGGNDLISSGAGNDTVSGGAGHDILLGGDGNDSLSGDAGRDLLIGARGGDFLYGNADQDILVAGYTAFDADEIALRAILAEWTSDRTYSQRLHNLSKGTAASGLDNKTYSSRLNGSYYMIGNDGNQQTVFNDDEVDTLTGHVDATDWFLANKTADNGEGSAKLDKIIDLAIGEIYTDTDY